MVVTTRFGRKLWLPSTAAIKHQILVMWLKDQLAIEAAAAAAKPEAGSPIERPA